MLNKMFTKYFGIFFSIILYFGFVQIFEVTSSKCSKIYVLPLLAQDTGCLKLISGELTCARYFGIFLHTCSDVTLRQLITVFNFNYSTAYTCLVNNIINLCHGKYNDGNNVTLERNKHFGVWSQFTRRIEEDKRNNCFNNSLAIFVTDIPYQDFHLYPDIDSIFGYNLNMNLKYLFDENLHAFTIWLNLNDSQLINQPSNKIKNLTNFTETTYMKLHFITYNDFFDYNGGDLCAADNFPVLSNYDPLKQHTLEKVIEIVSGVILLLILLFILFWIRQIYRRWQESKIEAFADAHAKSARHILFGNYYDEWEVTPKELKVDSGTVLGKGAFGVVYKGFLKKKRNDQLIEMDVAVKFTTEHSTETMRQDMISEIGFMKSLGSHENLLVMVGYVKSIDNPLICTMFCSNGDLLKILQKHELHFMSSNPCSDVEICLVLPDLLRIAIEVCNGLCYLASLNYIHRDIAARNVLLTDQLVAKLSDFGLCKKLENRHEFLVDKEGKLPIKYMPYESIKMGHFGKKSDVWSFGILIWEMFSGGKKPFENMEFDEFFNFLEEDGKPELPEETPQPLVQLLNEKVLQKDPLKRCNFNELKQDLLNFHSIVCSVLIDEERSSVRSSIQSSVRRRV